MRKIVVAAVVAVLPALFVQAPADAALIKGCFALGTVTFDPPLTTQRERGTMTWSYSATCAHVDTGGASGLVPSGATFHYPYDGSCITADVAGLSGGDGLLVGGVSVTTYRATPPYVRETILIPQSGNPCNMSSALAVQVGGDVT